MSEESGVVLSSGDGYAKVRLDRTSKCSTCGGCFFSETQRYMIAEAEDPIGVSPGDTVVLQNRISAPRAGFLLYILPLIAFVGGYAATAALRGVPESADADIPSILVGILFMATSYLSLFIANKRAARKRKRSMRIARRVATKPSPERQPVSVPEE